MPADSSIYSLIRKSAPQAGPIQQYGQVMQLRNLMDQQGLSALQRQQLERSIAEEDATSAAYREGGGDPMKVRDLLRQRGYYKPAMSLDKTIAGQQKDAAELAAKKMETFVKGVGFLKDRLPTVRDDASYAAYVDTAKQLLGPDMVGRLNLPATFDPVWVRNQTVKAEELFTPKPTEQKRPDGSIVIVDMNPFTNQAIIGQRVEPGQTPTEKDASARGWAGLTQSAQIANKPTWDSERGVFVTNPVQVGAGRGGAVPAGAAPAGVPATVAPQRPLATTQPAGMPQPSAPGVYKPPGLPERKSDAKLTDTQGNAAGFGMRAAESNRILTELEKAGQMNTGITRSIVSGAAEMVPFVGDKMGSAVHAGMNVLPEFMGGPSGAQQQVDQARRDFVNAVLRKESGAVISPVEFDNAIKQYFPQPGDSDETVAQKQRNRMTAIEALKVQAGPGGANVKPQAPAQPQPAAGFTQQQIDDELRRRGIIK